MKELNEEYLERLFINADELIAEEKVPEAKTLLLEILAEEPAYGRAHNHLGWIYTHVIVDYEKAEKHLKLALKYAKGYPGAISNYGIYLLEANKNDELIAFADEYINQLGADNALLMALKGNALEVKGNLRAALKLYKEAKKCALNIDFIEQVKVHIERVNLKIGALGRILATL